MDRDFEAHLQNLFDAPPPAFEDTERFARLIERDLRRMRRAILWASGVAVAGLMVGVYLAIDPLWSRWSYEILRWVAQAKGATPHIPYLTQIAAMTVAAGAALVGMVGGRRI